MKEFMLLIRNESDHFSTLSPDDQQAFLDTCMVYIEKLKEENKLIEAQPLEREGKIIFRSKGVWKDKPFTESKEVIVGYYHVLAKDMSEAIAIAKANPEFEYGPTARVEVRPIKVKEETTGYKYSNK